MLSGSCSSEAFSAARDKPRIAARRLIRSMIGINIVFPWGYRMLDRF